MALRENERDVRGSHDLAGAPARVASSFGRTLESPPPDFSGDAACRLAAKAFGLAAASAQPFPYASECDQLFHITASDGREYAMRIANPAQPLDVLDFQLRALEHAASRDPSLPLPRVQRTLSGDAIHIARRRGRSHAVRLLTYLPGTPLLGTMTTPELRQSIGGLIARFDLALAGFSHPAAHHAYIWDVKQAASVASLETRLTGASRRLVETAFERFARHVTPILGSLRAQVLHNDLNPKNILVDRDDARRVTGIIDFGDMVHSPLVFDPSVAISKLLLDLVDIGRIDDVDPIAIAGDVLGGYHRLVPLVEDELAIVLDVAIARLAMRVQIRAWRATRSASHSLDPALVRSGDAILERVLPLDRVAVARRFSDICQQAVRPRRKGKP
jgi:Ser/Thr protein kinase RdoA (MazF antagonist)